MSSRDRLRVFTTQRVYVAESLAAVSMVEILKRLIETI